MCILKIILSNLFKWELVRVFFFGWQTVDAAPHTDGFTPASVTDNIS